MVNRMFNVPFKDKIFLITGCTGHLGSTLSKALAQKGASLILVGRSVDALEKLDDEIKTLSLLSEQSITLVPSDLTKTDTFPFLAQQLSHRFKCLDGLIHCAAALRGLVPLKDWDEKSWRSQFILNVDVPWTLIKALDPLLQKSSAGRVVAISDRILEESCAYWGAYATSKAALEKMIEVYAEESKATRIKAHVVRTDDFPSTLKEDIYSEKNRKDLIDTMSVVHAIEDILGDSPHVSGSIVTVKKS
ncbi:MAG: SDR family NAD(P)-dependent oxidoreductase [Caedimonadaceae bacterium]|nr:MAG: SDR family NAD(P)-dependent oxidoreductase [Caedimonadaceae bacterium]